MALSFTDTPLIFQIGMHKTATCALNWAFEQLGIPSCHVQPNRFKYVWPFLAQGRDPDPPFDNHQAFTDFLWIETQEEYDKSCDRVRLLKDLYPNARFILNTRNVDDWLQSHVSNNALNGHPLEPIDQMCAIKRRWYAWHAFVLELFEDAPQRLLCFDIDRDPFERVANFIGATMDKPVAHYWQWVYVTPKDIKQPLPSHSWWCK